MAPYDNTLGLVVANGALSTIYSTAVAPTIKTVIRDVKRYMATAYASTAGQQRPLPVGYSAANGRLILKTTFEYFAAGEPEETIDFFCVSTYSNRPSKDERSPFFCSPPPPFSFHGPYCSCGVFLI